jgi:hypothetical protein
MRWVAVLLSGLVALPAEAAPPHAAAKAELIARIDGVTASLKDHRLLIQAKGAVRSGGWSAPALHVETIQPAGDQTLVVDFTAVPPPPDNAVIEELLPVEASITARARRGTVAVRVVSGSNEITTQILP